MALSWPGSAASLHGGRRLEQPVEIRLIRQAPMRAAGLARQDCSEARVGWAERSEPTILIELADCATLQTGGHASLCPPYDTLPRGHGCRFSEFLVAAAASLCLSSLAIAQPAPAPVRAPPRPVVAPAPGQQPPAAAPRAPRAAACHNGMSFDRFLADLKQQARGRGRLAARARPRPRPTSSTTKASSTATAASACSARCSPNSPATGRPMALQKMRRRESRCMRRRSRARKRNMACRRR